MNSFSYIRQWRPDLPATPPPDIGKSPIPLVVLWVFDLPSQNADYNITAGNARPCQLREVAEANARVQKGGTIGRRP